VLSNALEAFGVMCLAAFAFFVWWPLALVPVGLYLIVAGLALDRGDGE
jgi:hypothetical protein